MLKAREDNIKIINVSDFKALPGNGLTALLDGNKIAGGNLRFMESLSPKTMDQEIRKEAEKSTKIVRIYRKTQSANFVGRKISRLFPLSDNNSYYFYVILSDIRQISFFKFSRVRACARI